MVLLHQSHRDLRHQVEQALARFHLPAVPPARLTQIATDEGVGRITELLPRVPVTETVLVAVHPHCR